MQLPGPWENIVKDSTLGSRHGFDSMCCPTYYRSGCHETLQATEGGRGRVCRGMACDDLPCGRRSLHIWDDGDTWRPFCYTSAALVALATPKSRWLGCVVHTSEHLLYVYTVGFLHFFTPKFNLRINVKETTHSRRAQVGYKSPTICRML